MAPPLHGFFMTNLSSAFRDRTSLLLFLSLFPPFVFQLIFSLSLLGHPSIPLSALDPPPFPTVVLPWFPTFVVRTTLPFDVAEVGKGDRLTE